MMWLAVSIGLSFLLALVKGQLGLDGLLVNGTNGVTLQIAPDSVTMTRNSTADLTFRSTQPLLFAVIVHFNSSPYYEMTPSNVLIPANSTAQVTARLKALSIVSEQLVEPASCSSLNTSQECPFTGLNNSFVRLSVVHSDFLVTLIAIVGWIYFFAWSISFYPQMWLNFKRKSVVGLNFDFMALNLTGFSCYAVFNVVMYWDRYVQALYQAENPHTSNPVFLNDVIFAVHAFFACLVTIIQCFIYEKGEQRVSYTCRALVGLFCAFAGVSLALALFVVINWLQFVRFLSYIKIGVTLSKYFPQAFYNYQRKSTVGWSIGNILLDFTGGSMDILQMVLQALNTDDWRNFTGNKVKFLLGLISIAFDLLFIVQHYVLYRHASDVKYEHLDDEGVPAVIPVRPGYGSTEDLSSVPQGVRNVSDS